jgi:hypothetical protein
MSKSASKVKIPVSPDYRTAPGSLIEDVLGLIIIIASGLSVIYAIAGEAFIWRANDLRRLHCLCFRNYCQKFPLN